MLLRISLHDIQNQILYLDDTKTGNNRVILTPNMIKAYKYYMMYRVKPKHKEDEDKLVIIDKGNHNGLSPTPQSQCIYRKTKKIAARAGFVRSVYPYLIKPSSITNGFNNKVNPRILQRQARHSRIETTLRYDHTDDEMTKEYFNQLQAPSPENLKPGEDAKEWLDKLLSNDIDIKTFKTGIDVLLPHRQKEGDIGYI